jgi:hypothetical protein
MGKYFSKNKKIDNIDNYMKPIIDTKVLKKLQKNKRKLNNLIENNLLENIFPPIIISNNPEFELNYKLSKNDYIKEYSLTYFVGRKTYIIKSSNQTLKLFHWDCCGSRLENHLPNVIHENEYISFHHFSKNKNII